METKKESSDADQIILEAANLKEEKFYFLPASIAESKTALAKMLNNAEANHVLKAKHQEYRIKFENRHYVREVLIDIDGSASGQFELSWESWTKNRFVSQKSSATNNQVIFRIGDLITEFSLLPPEKLLGISSITIKSVKVVGIPQHEFEEKMSRLGTIEKLRKEIQEEANRLQAQINSFDSEVGGRQKKILECQEELDKLEQRKEMLDEEIASANETLSDTNLTIKAAEDRLKSLHQTSDSVASDITNKKASYGELVNEIANLHRKLGELKSQINLFPTEIKGFADEGAAAISKYLILSFLPIVLIFLLGYDLYASGKTFASTVPKAAIETIYAMAARLPYVVIVFTIAGAAFKISQIFVNEIISIYRQRLNLTKLSILAKDVSDSSAAELGLNDSELYEKRVYLKMLILREHLKSYLPASFSYVERVPTNEEIEGSATNAGEKAATSATATKSAVR